MEQAFKLLFDSYKYLIRDILFYIIPGFIVIGQIAVFDYYSFESKYSLKFFGVEYSVIVLLTLMQITGHFCHALAFTLLELSALEGIIKKKLGWVAQEKFQSELHFFNNNEKAYEYFIERYNQLSYFRYGLAGAFFCSAGGLSVCFLLNGIELTTLTTSVLIANLSVGAIFYIFHLRTEYDFNTRLSCI